MSREKLCHKLQRLRLKARRGCSHTPRVFLLLLWSLALSGQSLIADGVLRANPRITTEEAERIAREFLAEPDVKFNKVEVVVGRRDRWIPIYKLQGIYDISIDALTGDILSVYYWQAWNRTNSSKSPPKTVSEEEAIRVAHAFAQIRYPGFDPSFSPFVSYERTGDGYYVGFSRFEMEGIWPGYGPRVEVSSKTGEILRYVAYYPSITISMTARTTKEEAMDKIKSLSEVPLEAVRIYPYVHQDAIGEQILFYDSAIEWNAEYTDLDGTRKMRKAKMHIDFSTNTMKQNDYPGYDLDAMRPELKRKMGPLRPEVPMAVGVTFDGHGVILYTPPLARKRAVLVSKELFEALGGKVTWNKDTGEIVVEKGDDPVVLHVGSKVAMLDDKKTEMEVAPEMHKDYRKDPVEDRLFIPTSLIQSILGMKVKWDEKAWTLSIDSSKSEKTKEGEAP